MEENNVLDNIHALSAGANRVEDVSAYYDERIALVDNIKKIRRGDYIVDAYVCAMCTKGMASINVNNTCYHFEPNDILICSPNTLLDKSMFSADFEFRAMVMTVEFVKEFEMIFEDGWHFTLTVESNPVNRLTAKEASVFNNYWELIRDKLTGEHGKFHDRVITSIMTAFFFELRGSVERLEKPAMAQFNSSEKLYKKFMELLTSAFPKQREVKYYADQLCVTPKYLSAVCKQTTGTTASEIIYKYVINDVKFMLRRRDMSIKEVAFKLGFDNLSFFGKYTKRALGMSPKAFRLKGNM